LRKKSKRNLKGSSFATVTHTESKIGLKKQFMPGIKSTPKSNADLSEFG